MSAKTIHYKTQRGDMLDAICHRYYGERKKAVEAVLEANPGLVNSGLVLPAGVLLVLPDLGPAETKRIALWE